MATNKAACHDCMQKRWGVSHLISIHHRRTAWSLHLMLAYGCQVKPESVSIYHLKIYLNSSV